MTDHQEMGESPCYTDAAVRAPSTTRHAREWRQGAYSVWNSVLSGSIQKCYGSTVLQYNERGLKPMCKHND